jgi:hypothetical protein
MGSGCIDPHFLDVGTSWRWVVNFTPRPLYTRYRLDRRLGGPQSRSGRFGEVKILTPTGTWTPTPPSSSPYPVAIPTTLSRLPPLKGGWMNCGRPLSPSLWNELPKHVVDFSANVTNGSCTVRILQIMRNNKPDNCWGGDRITEDDVISTNRGT